MVKIIAKYVKELIVNKGSDLQTTTLIKFELFERYFSRILSKGTEQYFVEHLQVAASENFKKRKNTQTVRLHQRP